MMHFPLLASVFLENEDMYTNDFDSVFTAFALTGCLNVPVNCNNGAASALVFSL